MYPCPKPDGTYHRCTDDRKVNNITKSDTFPIPHMDDCIDRIGNAKSITKSDLLKGFWQVPLTDHGKEVSAFMSFGRKNYPMILQRKFLTKLSFLKRGSVM